MNALEVNALSKCYPGGIQALDAIHLFVEKGDFYALLGPNGAGKSTTIGILCDLVSKTSGNVKIFGYDIDQQRMQAKQKIGVVPQEFNFSQFEKVEHILLHQAGYYGVPKKEAKVRAFNWLNKLDLWDKRSVPARFLSGGMKRRLMIARALMHEPELLILDEPTAGVDIELRRMTWEFLKTLNASGTTIILTTHYLEEVEMLCRHVGIIDKGQLVISTSTKSLLAKLQVETFHLDARTNKRDLTLSACQYRWIDEDTLEVEIHKDQSLNGIFEQLTKQGVEITSMRSKSNRLEELFIRLVQEGRLK